MSGAVPELSGRAEWSVSTERGVSASEFVHEVERAYGVLRRQRDAVQATFAGAAFAGVFMHHDWLESFTLSLWASSEYDDSGGSYRSISSGVTEVRVAKGAALPEYLQAEGGGFYEYLAEDVLSQHFWDCECDLYGVFNGPDDYTEVSLTIRRSAIAHLLDEPCVSGHDAFVGLFPQHAHLARCSDAVTE